MTGPPHPNKLTPPLHRPSGFHHDTINTCEKNADEELRRFAIDRLAYKVLATALQLAAEYVESDEVRWAFVWSMLGWMRCRGVDYWTGGSVRVTRLPAFSPAPV